MTRLKHKIFFILSGILFVFITSITLLVSLFLIHQNNLTDASSLEHYFESTSKGALRRERKHQNRIIQYDSEYYCLITLSENSVGDTLSGTVFDNYTEQELIELAHTLADSGKTSGTKNHLRYLVSQINNTTVVSFLDASDTFRINTRTSLIGLFIWLIGIFLCAIISWLIASRIVRPVEESFNKQAQFISDASHELKTPLAVIQSNADILENELPQNKWLSYIQIETKRMSNLLCSLLTLSQMSDSHALSDRHSFDLSATILGTALPFESIAYERGIHYQIDIKSNLSYNGIESEMSQLASILLDNALKHVSDLGRVSIQLDNAHKSHFKYLLRVSNTGAPIPVEEQAHIFDRFYRVNKDRNRKEGRYGLGLAIADTIVKNHHGQIQVTCLDGTTSFYVLL